MQAFGLALVPLNFRSLRSLGNGTKIGLICTAGARQLVRCKRTKYTIDNLLTVFLFLFFILGF